MSQTRHDVRRMSLFETEVIPECGTVVVVGNSVVQMVQGTNKHAPICNMIVETDHRRADCCLGQKHLLGVKGRTSLSEREEYSCIYIYYYLIKAIKWNR